MIWKQNRLVFFSVPLFTLEFPLNISAEGTEVLKTPFPSNRPPQKHTPLVQSLIFSSLSTKRPLQLFHSKDIQTYVDMHFGTITLLFLTASSLALPSSKTCSSAAKDKICKKRAAGCPSNFKNVVFNGGYKPEQFSQIKGASNFVTFNMKTDPGQLPMMPYATDVPAAVKLVKSPNPPEYLLTFNEPDYSYEGLTPTMSPQQAAEAIKPLLASPGNHTKFIAPVTANPGSSWLTDFYAACNCQSFFYAYNMHVYKPTLDAAQRDITNFHTKFSDKPLWITEIAPGQANPACSLSVQDVQGYMTQLYSWGAKQGWIGRIFWNSGNEIPATDHNVCNSYLLDFNSQSSALLNTFNGITCS